MVDHAKIRRESMRWNIMLTLNNARPVGAYEELVLSTIQAIYPDATTHELRREIDYLAERQLCKVTKEPIGRWFCELTPCGVDIAEYTVDCRPGIARPVKYWAS